MKKCETWLLGFVTYENGLATQERLVALRQKNEIADQLLLLEHPPVITLGRGGDVGNLRATPEVMARHGVRFYETSRGGDITVHGPGQLVGYPILHLGEGRRDIRKYVTNLEEALIRTVAGFGVTAHRSDLNRGIWVGGDKLAAIGVRIARWVTSHGFALNVTSDLSHFELVNPCGLRGAGVTSVEKLTGARPSIEEVGSAFTRHFAEVFDREIEINSSRLEVAKVVAHDGNDVLLLHRRPECGGFWQPITGQIEPGETPLEAAVRETAEELGSTVGEVVPLEFKQSFSIGPEYLESDSPAPVMVEETSFSTRMPRSTRLALDLEEHDDARWFSFEEAYGQIRWSNDRETLERLEKNLSSARTADLSMSR